VPQARLVTARNIAALLLAVLVGSILRPTDRLAGLVEPSGAAATATARATSSPATPAASPSATDGCLAFPDAPSTDIDQAAAIEAFLIEHRAETVCFEAGATYRVDQTVTLRGWSGTVLGRGATWRRSAADAGEGPTVRLVEGRGIVFDGLTIVGAATLDDIEGRQFSDNDRQGDHAYALESATDVTIRNGRATNTWGDGVYIRGWDDSAETAPSRNVRVDNLVLDVNGRNAISVISVDGLVVTAVRSSNVSLHGFDAEPNRSSDTVTNVRIEGSDWRTFDAAGSDAGPGYAIVLTPGYADVQVRDVAIVDNTMDRPMIRVEGFSAAAPASNITVTGNRAEAAGDATFRHIRGFTFSDNGSIGAQRDDVE
jgi:hypothetical protein